MFDIGSRDTATPT